MIFIFKQVGKGGLEVAIGRLIEREMLLVCLYKEREDMYEGNFHRSRWVFYWNGEWVRFLQHDYGKELFDNHWKKTRIIKEITMSSAVKNKALDLFCDLKEAFEAYRIIGAGEEGDEYLFDLTLDVSEVIYNGLI